MYQIGDMVAHPKHGAGIIDRIEEKNMYGCTRTYCFIKDLDGGMISYFPIECAEQIGVRPIIDSDKADELMAAIPKINAEMTANWNKRHRENLELLTSGNLLEVARVVKGLMIRNNEKELSTGERKMLQNAKQIFISEIVLSTKLTSEEVESRINASLA